jgi:hypothetical protein
MTLEVTKTVLNKIIHKRLEQKWTNIIIWPRDLASISVQQLRIHIFFHFKIFLHILHN